jgi:hypothetical protein
VNPDFGTDPELFYLPALVLLAGLLQLFFTLIAKFGKIRELADRRVVQWSYFDEVRVLVLGNTEGFLYRLDP